jgi:hypothetical protein
MLGGFTRFVFRAIVIFAIIAMLGGYALAQAASNVGGTAGGQGAAATMNFFQKFAAGYQEANGSNIPLPAPSATR